MLKGVNQPMSGITLLRNVVSKDSTYVDAQVQLGMFVIKADS